MHAAAKPSICSAPKGLNVTFRFELLMIWISQPGHVFGTVEGSGRLKPTSFAELSMR
jgi:hypothetical protein